MKKLLCSLLLTVISVGFINAQSIDVTGLGIVIPGDGTNTPIVTDDTEYGSVDVASGSVQHTFTINNLTTDILILGLNNLTNSVDFSQSVSPSPNTIFSGGSSSFSVTFDPESPAGLKATVVSVSVFNLTTFVPETYFFNIQGTAIEVTEPDINLFGNGISITNGDVTPSTADDTDFGSLDITTGSLTRTFTILNTGDADLTITNNVLFIGSSDFTIDTQPSTPITPGNFSTFDITFDPSSTGPISGTVLILSDDPDENPFTYTIQGVGTDIQPEPEINITGNGISIVNGDVTPDVADDTDFGQVDTTTGSVTNTFTIENLGTSDLTLAGNVLVIGSSDFTISVQPSSPIGASGFSTFNITFDPSVTGSISATILIQSDDADENPYTFLVQGEGIVIPVVPEIDIQGLGNSIASGDTTPSTTDDTDYGQLDVTTGNLQHTFTILNTGNGDLSLTGANPFINISGANAADFTVSGIPSATIAGSGSTTFAITFNPSNLGVRTATISIANDDTDENPYTFDVQGEGIDVNSGSPLLITQYYEGLAANDNWIEVKNVSASLTTPGEFYLVIFKDLNGTTGGGIATYDPNDVTEAVQIPALSPGEVALFKKTGASLPTSGNLGSVSTTTTDVCDFDGDDILVITTTNDANAYNSRIDVIGTVGTSASVNWGPNVSLIKGCGTIESPSLTYDPNQYITLTLDEVDNASTLTNIALGIQTVGPTIWTSSWDNGNPDKTKNAIINGSYTAANGSFDTCDLTVNGGSSININSGGTTYVKVNEGLTVNGSFIIGDTESLVMVNPDASVSGQISKIERTTALNNYRDITYWSAPVSTSIGSAFTGVDPNRIFRWDKPGIESPTGGAWTIASGSMTAARGYIAEAPLGSTQHTVTFTGTPNNGLVGIQVGFVNDGFEYTDYNLIGNPYPSAVNIDQFISLGDNSEIRDNDDLDGTIYLWTHSTQISGGTDGDFTDTDYATYNLAGGTASANGGPTPTNNIGSGQGFMVRTKSSGTVFFENDMRLDNQNTQFFKSNKVDEEKDRLWLNMTSEQGAFNQILVGFFDEATDGVDRGYDGIKNNGGSFISFYSNIDDSRYVIQGLGTFNQSKEVTLGFDTGIARTFKIAISNIEGILKDEDVYLVDNTLNIVHDLKQSAYEFEITETGVYSDRFTLKFNNAVLDIEDFEFSKNFLVINEDNTLRIKANQEVSKLRVFDMLGRLLIDQKPNESDFYLNTTNIKKGTILILNATMQDGSVVSKKGIKY